MREYRRLCKSRWVLIRIPKKKLYEIDSSDEAIEEQNKKITHIIWIIFISMITSMITVFLATGSIGL